MKRTLHLVIAVTLFCGPSLHAQAVPQSSQKSDAASTLTKNTTDDVTPPVPQDIEALERKHEHEVTKSNRLNEPLSSGQVDILSDTMGVDFGPYLQRVLHNIRLHWYDLIPQVARPPIRKTGRVTIEFSILKDGRIDNVERVESSGDLTLDRAAWGGIMASNPLPALPSEFRGEYLALRFHFAYNPEKNQWDHPTVIPLSFNQSLKMSASAAMKMMVKLPAGASQQFSVTSSERADKRVLWSLSGIGCTEAACGTISATGLYKAPSSVPSPASVVVKATLADDPIRTASAIVMIVPNSSQ